MPRPFFVSDHPLYALIPYPFSLLPTPYSLLPISPARASQTPAPVAVRLRRHPN